MITNQMDHAGVDVFTPALAATNAKVVRGSIPAVGSTVRFSDGREYVFVKTAVDLLAGNVVGIATALATPIDNALTAAAAGDYEVKVNLTGIQLYGATAGVLAANRLAGGYLVIDDDAGEGHTYIIKGNTAGSAAAPTTTLTLATPVRVALTVASDIFIVGPSCDFVVQGTATLPPLGVAVVATTAATAGVTQYFWAQTKGLCGVTIKTGTNVAIGKNAAADADGGVKLAGADTDIIIGVFAGTDATASVTVPIYLKL